MTEMSTSVANNVAPRQVVEPPKRATQDDIQPDDVQFEQPGNTPAENVYSCNIWQAKQMSSAAEASATEPSGKASDNQADPYQDFVALVGTVLKKFEGDADGFGDFIKTIQTFDPKTTLENKDPDMAPIDLTPLTEAFAKGEDIQNVYTGLNDQSKSFLVQHSKILENYGANGDLASVIGAAGGQDYRSVEVFASVLNAAKTNLQGDFKPSNVEELQRQVSFRAELAEIFAEHSIALPKPPQGIKPQQYKEHLFKKFGENIAQLFDEYQDVVSQIDVKQLKLAADQAKQASSAPDSVEAKFFAMFKNMNMPKFTAMATAALTAVSGAAQVLGLGKLPLVGSLVNSAIGLTGTLLSQAQNFLPYIVMMHKDQPVKESTQQKNLVNERNQSLAA